MAGSLWRLLRAAHHMPRLVSLVVANCAELVASEPFLMQQEPLSERGRDWPRVANWGHQSCDAS